VIFILSFLSSARFFSFSSPYPFFYRSWSVKGGWDKDMGKTFIISNPVSFGKILNKKALTSLKIEVDP